MWCNHVCLSVYLCMKDVFAQVSVPYLNNKTNLRWLLSTSLPVCFFIGAQGCLHMSRFLDYEWLWLFWSVCLTVYMLAYLSIHRYGNVSPGRLDIWSCSDLESNYVQTKSCSNVSLQSLICGQSFPIILIVPHFTPCLLVALCRHL